MKAQGRTVIGFVCFKCKGLKGAQMLASLTHTISHLMENEGKKKGKVRARKIRANQSVTFVTPSPHHTCSFTGHFRSFSFSLYSYRWMRFAD